MEIAYIMSRAPIHFMSNLARPIMSVDLTIRAIIVRFIVQMFHVHMVVTDPAKHIKVNGAGLMMTVSVVHVISLKFAQ